MQRRVDLLTLMVAASAALAPACSSDSKTAPVEEAPSGEIVETEVTTSLTFDARAAGPESGELVVLLHGFPETSYEWRHQLRALGAAGYRAVAPNQRGYSPGARPAEVDAYDVEELVNDVLEMADALGADRFHLVGHDWGAAVAWGVAAMEPSRLSSLTTVSIPHPAAFAAAIADPSSCQYQASGYFDLVTLPGAENILLANDAEQLRGLYTGLPDDAIDDYIRVLGTPEALGAALNWYRANIEDRQFVGIPTPATTVPTLFIWSDADSAICREPAEATADHVAGPYQFEVIEGVDHWVPENAPERVTELLIDHVRKY